VSKRRLQAACGLGRGATSVADASRCRASRGSARLSRLVDGGLNEQQDVQEPEEVLEGGAGVVAWVGDTVCGAACHGAANEGGMASTGLSAESAGHASRPRHLRQLQTVEGEVSHCKVFDGRSTPLPASVHGTGGELGGGGRRVANRGVTKMPTAEGGFKVLQKCI
jgi:hypothetical protein